MLLLAGQALLIRYRLRRVHHVLGLFSYALMPAAARATVNNLVRIMSMKNIQIAVDEETLRQVDRASKPLGLKRSEIVRQALRQWLRHRTVERFEADWIAALNDRPDERSRADDWLDVQVWSRK